YGLVENENSPAVDRFAAENLSRQFSLLRSIALASVQMEAPVLSIEIIKALHFTALACLHPGAGQYRSEAVEVSGGFSPPAQSKIPALMEMFVVQVNRLWDRFDAVTLAAFVLW